VSEVPVRLAPVLAELAGRLAGRPAGDARTHPMQWAYALRDAAGLAHPDVLVSHWDPTLEADALAGAVADGEGDWVDRLMAAPALAQTPPTQQAVEIVATLAGLFRSGPPIAATITGPVSTAAALAPVVLGGDATDGDRTELADLCADALAGLIGAFAEAGASLIVVVEQRAEFVEDVANIQAPLVRALAHHRVDGIAVASAGVELPGYGAQAVPWDGTGAPPPVALLAPETWDEPPERFAERWSALLASAGGALLLSDGPLPAAMPLENLQTARVAHA
jgi:hypothetical protein